MNSVLVRKGLEEFGTAETARIRASAFDRGTISNNGTYQRRAEVTLLLLEQLECPDTLVTAVEMFAITNRIKDLADYHYLKAGFRQRFRFRRMFKSLVRQINIS